MSSSYAMICRDRQRKQHIRTMRDYDIIDVVPNNPSKKTFDYLYQLLKGLHVVTKPFKPDTATLAEVRSVLEDVIPDHPSNLARFNSNANIILNFALESAISKLQAKNESSLTTD